MGDISEPLAPRVFFSYTGDDEWWIDLFRPFFKVGPVRILDYKDESVAFGELRKALDGRIEGSDVVVAFVSRNYIDRKWTVAEWEKGLSEAEQRRLIFVPILLDADSIVWWEQRRLEKRLPGLSDDYQPSIFSNDNGRYALPSRETPKYIQKIVDLASTLQKRLNSRKDVPPRPDAPTKTLDVVLLGHPSASLPPDLQAETQQLVSALGTSVVTWDDGWRAEEAPRAAIEPKADPVFVQPITNAEAADYIKDRNKTNEYLAEVGRPKSRVAIWLPTSYPNRKFEQAAKEGATTRSADEKNPARYPVLLANSPEGLAKWLWAEISGPTSPDEKMTVQVEGMGTDKVSSPEDVIAAKLKVDHLRDAVWGIVNHVVAKPKPASPALQFWQTQFGKQIKNIKGSRAIVAIHDLDIRPNSDLDFVRQQVEIKFEDVQNVVEAEQKQRIKDGKPCLNLFWTALLVNNADALPYSHYPDDGRFKDWRLLEFTPSDKKGGERSVPVPDPVSLAVFRMNLLAWAATP